MRGERAVFNQAQYGEVVGEGARGGNHFDEVRGERFNARGGVFQSLGPRKVMKADQQRRAGGAQFGQLSGAGFLGRLDFKVEDLATGFSGSDEKVDLGVQRAGEAAAMFLAAAGGDRCRVAVFGQKFLEPGQCGSRFGEGVEAEFQELRVFQSGFGTFRHLLGRGGLDGDADLSQAQPQNGGRRDDRDGTCVRHGHQLTHLNGDARRMQQPSEAKSQPEAIYSSRSVLAGSMRAMRKVGTVVASRVTAARVSTTAAMVGAS